MDLSFLDNILKFIPSIKKPDKPLSFREKLKWTAIIMSIYFVLFSTTALGVNSVAISSNPALELVTIIFAARIGSLITVGIGPIVLSSIVIQLIQGAGLLKIDPNDTVQRTRMQGVQKLSAMAIAIIEAVIFVKTGYVPITSSAAFGLVAFQLALCAIFIIYLDETMTKYGITSGINLFIAGGVAYSIIAGTINIIIIGEIVPTLANPTATTIPTILQWLGPLFFTIIVMLISIYVYDIKVEVPLVFEQFRGVGGRLPIPFLYVSVLPVILATSLEASITVWFRFLNGVTGALANTAKFFALYQNIPTSTGGSSLNLVGGLAYLISPNTFPLPYSAAYGGVGGYGAYITYLAQHTSQLFLPWGGYILVPEWIHIVTYTVVLVILCVVFGKFWVEMTGQNPKNVADQLQSVGWQIPGFRRDPRIVENMLAKYINTITVLGSIFVGLLAALATLSGAVGTGMGVLLTVGIMYMIYQQLEQENALAGIPGIGKLLT